MHMNITNVYTIEFISWDIISINVVETHECHLHAKMSCPG